MNNKEWKEALREQKAKLERDQEDCNKAEALYLKEHCKFKVGDWVKTKDGFQREVTSTKVGFSIPGDGVQLHLRRMIPGSTVNAFHSGWMSQSDVVLVPQKPRERLMNREQQKEGLLKRHKEITARKADLDIEMDAYVEEYRKWLDGDTVIRRDDPHTQVKCRVLRAYMGGNTGVLYYEIAPLITTVAGTFTEPESNLTLVARVRREDDE